MRVNSFGVYFDVIGFHEAIDTLSAWLSEPLGACRFVVTPNVDHLVILADRPDFREAYTKASLCLTDGWPVGAALTLLHKVEVPVVPGSDLVPGILSRFSKHDESLRVFLLGAAPGVADEAAKNISTTWPCIDIVGTMSPPHGFERDHGLCMSICEAVSSAEPDLLIVGLGAPKQELWVEKYRDHLGVKVAVCAGATIDFLAGNIKRAPRWIRRVRLEWAFRLIREPRRLAKRYIKDAIIFPWLLLEEFSRTRQGRIN